MKDQLHRLMLPNVTLVPEDLYTIRIPIPNNSLPEITFTKSPYPQVSANIEFDTVELKRIETKLDLTTPCYDIESDERLSQLKDIAIDKFVSHIKRRLESLNEKGIQVYINNNPVDYETKVYRKPESIDRHHRMYFDYFIMEGEQYYKHCFADSIYREGAVKEAVDHCKSIMRSKLYRIFNRYEREINERFENKFNKAINK